MKFKLFGIIVLCVIGSGLGQNTASSRYKDSIPLDPAVRYGKLENGFTYYIQYNANPNNSVELRLVVKAGRIHEDEDQLEYAHLLEHLLAGKTKHFPEIKEYFSKIGGSSNAHVGSRHTVYVAKIPSQDIGIVYDGIRLLRDWAQGIQWDEDYILMQRGAIEGEMRVSDPYRNWASKNIQREVLKNTGYKTYDDKKRLLNIQNLNPAALMRFYKDWYRPDLQAAIVVGDINVDSIEKEIKRRFSDHKQAINPKNAGEILGAHTIQLDGSIRFSIVTDSISQELNLSIIRLRPNNENQLKTWEDYQEYLLQQLYTTILDSKVKQMKKEYDPPFTSFETNYGLNQLPDKQLNGTLMKIGLETGDLQLMKKQFQRSLITWKQLHSAFTKSDFERAKTALYAKYTSERLMNSKSIIRRYEDHFIYGKAAPYLKLEAKLVSDILSGIQLKDIREYNLKYGNLDKNTVFIFFKGKYINIPKQEVFRKWMEETETMKIMPLEEERVITSLENVIERESNNIMEEVEFTDNEIGITTVELSNGIKVVFKPTTPRISHFSNTINIQAFRPNRVPVENRMEYLAANVAPQVLQFTGAGTYNKFELDQFMRERRISLNFRTTRENQEIYAQSNVDDLSQLLSLLHLYLKKPREDQKAFAAWKREKKIQMEGRGLRGSSEFVMDKIQASWYPQVPVLEIEDLQELTMEQVIKASKKWFSSVEDFTFIVTGDFEKKSLIPIIINTLSNFPVKNNDSLIWKPNFDFPLKKAENNLVFKNIDQVYVRLFFPIKAPRGIKTQIELQLLSRALNKHIRRRLRSGSYSPRASGQWLDMKNGIFAFRIDFDSALGNEEKMIEDSIEEFRKLREYGVDKNWLETAIIHELRNYESRFNYFGHFNFWSDYLQLKLEVGEDPVPGILNYGTLMEHFISVEDINSAAKKYMSEDHLQKFLGHPE